METPWVIRDKGSLVISSWEVMRYKFKLFVSGEPESESHNNHCFCYLDEADRTTASWQISPPTTGHYVLRIYGAPEAVISLDQPSSLELLVSTLIKCTRVSPKVPDLPVNDIPWGLTGDFYHLGLKMVIDDPLKWEGCKIVLKVGAKAMFKFVHKQWPIMSSASLYDNQVPAKLKHKVISQYNSSNYCRETNWCRRRRVYYFSPPLLTKIN